jgi:dihydrofolate reductase
VVDEVSGLKREIGGELVVYASAHLVATLLEHNLVDELRLIVYPVVLGSGQRLLGNTGEQRSMRLIASAALGDDLVSLAYQLDAAT